LISSVVLVDRLREVRVLAGFRRHKMTGLVSANLDPRRDFLPAVEVFGEGLFIQFEESAVAAWERLPQVAERCRPLAARKRRDNLTWLREPSPRRLLLHTFAHLLLRQTAFEAGYATSSIRERLYVTDKDQPAMAGILLYTAAGDSEGTLGGLARLGEAARLVPLLCSSLVAAQWCSYDPVCGESTAQGPNGVSLAACHACVLVPETSCSEGNRLLDRNLVVDPGIGFFRDVVAALAGPPGGGTW
nr:DUF1998 domain-containing protein [Micromonospora sp. DSM 115978]